MDFRNLPCVPGYKMVTAMTVPNTSIDSAFKRFISEVSELSAEAARETVDVADLLDEVVDVIYTARKVAVAAGVDPKVIDQWATDKGSLRASMGKNKRRERTFALGLLMRSALDEVVGHQNLEGEL